MVSKKHQLILTYILPNWNLQRPIKCIAVREIGVSQQQGSPMKDPLKSFEHLGTTVFKVFFCGIYTVSVLVYSYLMAEAKLIKRWKVLWGIEMIQKFKDSLFHNICMINGVKDHQLSFYNCLKFVCITAIFKN